ncbi:hypothetical protein I4F81_009685 [Pyropia yezoensis]|uniref:Uncharacterized protein n=1 Tax=Pyropia yezoensis TaxID=2788 RepID=A0ACC3CB23_PYRYE|nr:hypothetical protein I4F81_009685 [Neopyropia yezoensis]
MAVTKLVLAAAAAVMATTTASAAGEDVRFASRGAGESHLPLSFKVEDPSVTNRQSYYSPYGYGTGDPHFYGFNHAWFDFAGARNQAFNLISDAAVHVNAAFIGGPVAGQTFMGKVGIQAGGGVDRVSIAHCGYSCIEATVNGAALVADKETVTPSGARLLLTRGENATVEFEDATYRLKVSSPIADTVWKGGAEDTPHLDIAAELLGYPTDPHGVLGQTARHLTSAAVSRSAVDEDAAASADDFAIEGVDADYRVSGLFEADCVTSRFVARSAREIAAVRMAAARGGRKLLSVVEHGRKAIATAGVHM